MLLALFSLFTTSGFGSWLDPPTLSAGFATPICLAWAAAMLALGLAPLRRWTPTALLLALPALPMLGLLAFDAVCYYRLALPVHLESIQLPASIPIGILLFAWFLLHTSGTPARRTPGWMVLPLLVWMGLWLYVLVLLFSLPENRVPPAGPPDDIAIVFGHGVRDDGAAGPTLAARTQTAIDLYKAGRVRALFLSGSIDLFPDGREHSEVAAMAAMCHAAGIPDEDVVVDPVGINTRATVANVRHLLPHYGWTRLLAVSSDYHLPRIELAFAQAGLHVQAVANPPAVTGTTHFGGLLREAVGLPVYWLFPSYRPAVVDQMAVMHPRLVVTKSAGTLALYDGDRLVKTYRCITGSKPGDKQVEGDRKTPQGSFHICYKNPESNFHLSLGLDYPGIAAANRGLTMGLISQAQHDQIVTAVRAGGIPDWYTPLGGEIFIHGEGDRRDPGRGSAGCIVVTNAEIEELYAICDVGTEVEVRP